MFKVLRLHKNTRSCLALALLWLSFVTAHASITFEKKDGSIYISKDGRQLGSFGNLSVEESELWSDVFTAADGSLLIAISSNGSRDKFEVVVPIVENGDKLFTDCAYKSVYDSVDGGRSVGTSCKLTPLDKFDAESAINDENLLVYRSSYQWLKRLSVLGCWVLKGIEYASHKVALCSKSDSPDPKTDKTVVLDEGGHVVFTAVGYEFFPAGKGNGYALYANVDPHQILFEGSFACIVNTIPASFRKNHGIALIGKDPISYQLSTDGSCVVGSYRYQSAGAGISLYRKMQGNEVSLMELDKSNRIIGLFFLDEMGNGLSGSWVAAPPAGPLTVREAK